MSTDDGAAGGGGDKPAVLKDIEFTVEEGLAYRLTRTGAIWLNKLFLSSLVLLVVWLAYGSAVGDVGCAERPNLVDGPNGTVVDDGLTETCSVFLSATSKYLGAMALLSFILSLTLGGVGLVVGKNILPVAATEDELGARSDGEADEGTGESGGSDDGRPPEGSG